MQASRKCNRPLFHPLNGVLGVIQPDIKKRGTLASMAREMVNARMALALRENPPEALQFALLEAVNRHRPAAR